MSTVSVLNTDSGLSAKTLVTAEGPQTITGAKTFDLDPAAPFVVTAGSANVANLDADKLDGQDGSYYTNASNMASGILPAARVGLPSLCEGRLTLTSGTPITTGDVTAAGTIYFAPYKGNRIALYDGSATWTVYVFTERSLALTLTSGSVYDVFLYDNAGTPTLETLVWTSTTARATALTTQDGIYVKSGATTRRYLGTIYATGSNTTEDSFAKRYVWNYYNRDRRIFSRQESTASWTSTSTTPVQANASTTNQVEAVIGLQEATALITVTSAGSSNGGGGAVFQVGIGVDSATVATVAGINATGQSWLGTVSVALTTKPAIGRHFFTWLNWVASNTGTFYGTGQGTGNGLGGWIEG